MSKKPRPRKTNAKSKRKTTRPTRKAKPAAKKPAQKLAGLALRNIGFAAVPAAMEAAALTLVQKHRIVRHCIAVCSGRNDFSPNQPLYSIADGIEPCVEACVIDAVHPQSLIVRSTDTENLIVGMI